MLLIWECAPNWEIILLVATSKKQISISSQATAKSVPSGETLLHIEVPPRPRIACHKVAVY